MKKFLLVLAIILWLPFNVQAMEDTTRLTEEQNAQIERLYDYITNIQSEYEILNNMNPKEFVKNYIKNGDSGLSMKELFKYFSTYAFKEVLVAFKLVGSLIIVAIVCALLNNLQNAFSNESLTSIAYFACYSVMIILIVKGFYIGVTLARDAIMEMSNFIAALFPILMMLLASVGGFVEATLMDPIIMGISSVGARFYATVLIPVICMSFVLEFVNNISDDYKVNNLSNLLRKSALWIQGIFMTVFIAIITIRSIAAKSLDLVTMKTAKFAVDSFIPVVGKTLSDAISTVAGYTVLLKNAISSIGLIVIIVIMLLPIIKILIMAFIYKLTAALIEPISDKKVVSVIDSAGNSLIMINSCIISVSIMFFIMITIVASTGKSIIML
ncbi:stage III sporulation protein AE [Clostridium argentinense CDC 2741]|uniref:Stage III sporulation protein AE n=1 Tax=Clostridium argentinense CDC 2741 TaxID=1418104 RepID=A0A0C1U246_9CLOT|nr:stage III sporulation protein AE [Clostridium argentinense]ARC85236.1 stage III sporulation protein AE [Clostridium argentinense]KIE46949.1 stage III sporulation protein AE [Clostridium argentinense CDC 2741]NFF39458.1 stage III sporulation protein AE [Clostridium argentinense]NFP50995.1 stage III sporulation protein AE [Clostridium argentinense]NFP73611.1 stage III sporulation protein AE [Clostridium argentinense]